MPHALQIFSDSYKPIDPLFSKRIRQLLHAFDHLKVASEKAATSGTPGPDLFTALRELQSTHPAFIAAFKSRSQQLFFPQAEQILTDLAQLDRLVACSKDILTTLEERYKNIAKLVQELV